MAGDRKDSTRTIIEGLLRFLAEGGFITTALVLPNSAQIFDKPLSKLLDRLDKHAQERELRRVIHYMKHRGLIQYQAKDYEHGIKLTAKGKERLKRQGLEVLYIPIPKPWDKKWRLVFFDIPEEFKVRRNALAHRLRDLGFLPLQKSIWIHPFPCRLEIETVTELLGVRRFVTYVEVSHIDNEKQLHNRFKNILP